MDDGRPETTAGSSKRTKEVGVRKAVGAQQQSLMLQFLTESVLLAFIAGIVAWLIVAASLPAFNQLTGKQLHLCVRQSLVLVVRHKRSKPH